MSSKAVSCKIAPIKSEAPVIKIPSDVISKLNIDTAAPVTLKFGNLSALVTVNQETHPSAETMIKMSKKVQQQLRVPANIRLSLKSVGNRELSLGPVIGILTYCRTYEKNLFGFYRNYDVMLNSGLLYVFCFRGIHKETIEGHYFDPFLKKWVKADLPYPDAAIDRCYPNAYSGHTKLERVIGRGKIFNKKTMINKLDFHKALSGDGLLVKYLPETRIFGGVSDLKYFLDKYGDIFIKPLTGMKGSGIITVSLKNASLSCRYMEGRQVIERKMTDYSQIIEVLQSLGYPRRRYVIQNTVPRMEYLGKPLCFRVMVCKNASGQWLAPAIFPKAAAEKAFLTNHASGAGFVPLKQLFAEIGAKLGQSQSQFAGLLMNLGIKAAEALDKKYGPLGELGLDIIVDISGKPVLIEANGNPGMVPKSHRVEFPDWGYQMFNLPVNYAVFLSGFKT